jgi:hypothetical protein
VPCKMPQAGVGASPPSPWSLRGLGLPCHQLSHPTSHSCLPITKITLYFI